MILLRRIYPAGGRLPTVDLERYRIVLSVAGVAFLLLAPFTWAWGVDLLGSYRTIDLAHPYASIGGMQGDAFRYAPPIALLFYPLRFLSADATHIVWLTLELACLWYIGRRWFLALVLFPPVWLDLVYGNTNTFLAAAVAAGFRHPAAWAWPLLTKVTPGVGALWFLVRGEWRQLAIVGAVTAGIVSLSVVVQGVDVWAEWIGSLVASERIATDPVLWSPIPLALRLAAAAGLVAFGGLTDRPWVVPVAVAVAMPMTWPVAFAPLVALASRNIRARVPAMTPAGQASRRR